MSISKKLSINIVDINFSPGINEMVSRDSLIVVCRQRLKYSNIQRLQAMCAVRKQC